MNVLLNRLWLAVLVLITSLLTLKAQPVITTGSVGTGNFCAGVIVSFPFSTTGNYPAGNLFKVQLTDTTTNNVQILNEASSSSPIRAILPVTLAKGSYKFRIVSTTTSVISNTNVINVVAAPSVAISGNGSIVAGTQGIVQLNFTGTPPWSVDYIDYRSDFAPTYIRSAIFTSSPVTITPTLYFTTTYDKNYIKTFKDGNCGVSENINGIAQVTVSAITVTTGTLSGTYCPGTAISVPFATSSPLPADAICQVQLSDSSGNFQNSQIIGTGSRLSPVNATLPSSLKVGSGYKLRIVLQKPANQGTIDYSGAVIPISSSLTINRPEAPKVVDILFCSASKTSPLTATGVNLKWYAEGVAQPLPGAPTPPNDRSSRYFVSQTINGCESTLSTLNVIQKTAPPAPTVNNVALCQGLQGQFSTSIPGALWYTAATGGVGSAQPPVVNNQSPGDQIFYVTQTVDGCESPRAAVKATVYPIPSGPLVQTPVPICQFASANPLSATGQNLTWYNQAGKLPGAPIPETQLSGTKSYSVTQTVNGCESPRIAIEQVVRAAPANPTANSVQYCVGDVPRSLTATGSNLKWYDTAVGGTSSPSSPAFFTEQARILTFYVTQTDNNTCESQPQPVVVTIVSAPSAPTVTPEQIVCQFSKLTALTASPNTGLIWQGSGITGTSETAPIPSTSQPATFTYQVRQKAGSCTSPASTITYTVRKIPDAPKVASPVAFCIGQVASPLSAVAEGRLIWYTNPDHTGTSTSQIIPKTDRSSVTSYFVTQSDSYGCESLTSEIEVRVAAKASARLSGDGDIYVGDSTAIRVRLTGDGPWKFTNWNSQVITTTDSLYVKWEKPATTRTYAITNLSSACGIGEIANNYTLLVRTPLSAPIMAEPVSIKVYPNPTTGDVFVNWGSPTKQEVNLQIVDVNGKIIKQITRQSTGVIQTELIQLGNHPAGIYILRVMTVKNGVITRPIVKQ